MDILNTFNNDHEIWAKGYWLWGTDVMAKYSKPNIKYKITFGESSGLSSKIWAEYYNNTTTLLLVNVGIILKGAPPDPWEVDVTGHKVRLYLNKEYAKFRSVYQGLDLHTNNERSIDNEGIPVSIQQCTFIDNPTHDNDYGYLDAYDIGSTNPHDPKYNNPVVTRKKQSNDTQIWILKAVSATEFTIQQKSKEGHQSYLYAGLEHSDPTKNYGQSIGRFVTTGNRTANNMNQRWKLFPMGNSGPSRFRIKHTDTSKYLDAYTTKNHVHNHYGKMTDYQVVTRNLQNNNTQIWEIKRLHEFNNGEFIENLILKVPKDPFNN